MMDIRPLMLLARAISTEHGVNVRFIENGTARCICQNDKYIIELPLSNSENANMLYRGYIDHEIGHVRFTDFSEEEDTRSDIEKCLANIFEDEFVERRMGVLFPGSKINLRNLARHVFSEEHVQNALQKGNCLFAFALYRRRSLLDPELGQWNAEIDKAMQKLGVPDDVLAVMIALTAKTTNSTAENNSLAHELYTLMEPYLESQTSAEDFSVGARISQELEGSPVKHDPLLSQLVEGVGLAACTENENVNSLRRKCSDTPLDVCLVSALRKRLPPLLQSSRVKPCVVSTRGKLYGRRLARAAVLDARVFHAPAKKLGQEIEVGFLSDYSASMQGLSRHLDKAVYASLVMLKELPKVKSFAFGFNGSYYYKLVDKNAEKVHDFPGMVARSCTPLGPAMLNIVQEFAPAGRRVLIITTDGQPDAGLSATLEVVRLLEKMGIEIYAVGLGSGAIYLPKLFGEKSAVVETIAEYPACLEAMLRKAMLCTN